MPALDLYLHQHNDSLVAVCELCMSIRYAFYGTAVVVVHKLYSACVVLCSRSKTELLDSSIAYILWAWHASEEWQIAQMPACNG